MGASSEGDFAYMLALHSYTTICMVFDESPHDAATSDVSTAAVSTEASSLPVAKGIARVHIGVPFGHDAEFGSGKALSVNGVPFQCTADCLLAHIQYR